MDSDWGSEATDETPTLKGKTVGVDPAKPGEDKTITFKPKGGKKANMPDVIDQNLDGVDGPIDSKELGLALEEALALKIQIGVEPDEKKNIEGSGLLKKMHDMKETMAIIAATNGLEGLRHGQVAFTNRLQDGRSSLDTEKFCQELLAAGVKVDVITAAMKAATKTGEPFWVRQFSKI